MATTTMCSSGYDHVAEFIGGVSTADPFKYFGLDAAGSDTYDENLASFTTEHTTGGLARGDGEFLDSTPSVASHKLTVTYKFTATASNTVYGWGLFNSATPAGSKLLMAYKFTSAQELENNDTLTCKAEITIQAGT
jgi:hypothetical protein